MKGRPGFLVLTGACQALPSCTVHTKCELVALCKIKRTSPPPRAPTNGRPDFPFLVFGRWRAFVKGTAWAGLLCNSSSSYNKVCAGGSESVVCALLPAEDASEKRTKIQCCLTSCLALREGKTTHCRTKTETQPNLRVSRSLVTLSLLVVSHNNTTNSRPSGSYKSVSPRGLLSGFILHRIFVKLFTYVINRLGCGSSVVHGD